MLPVTLCVAFISLAHVSVDNEFLGKKYENRDKKVFLRVGGWLWALVVFIAKYKSTWIDTSFM
jgi:hypothetical protein